MGVLPHVVTVHVSEVLEELVVVVDGVVVAWRADQHLVLTPDLGGRHQPVSYTHLTLPTKLSV